MKRKSRKLIAAEILGIDFAELSEYQPGSNNDRLPIFDYGNLAVVVLPRDKPSKIEATLAGRKWTKKTHYDKTVDATVFEEIS
jgi:hypothetical protein